MQVCEDWPYTQNQIVTLFSVPTICEPLTSRPLVECRERYPHLSTLEFADDPGDTAPSQLHVDILIGSDHYWDLITGSVQRGINGPVAKLGWVPFLFLVLQIPPTT